MANIPKPGTPPWIASTRKAQSGRKSGNQKFYNSTAWRKLRAWFIVQFPLCKPCLKKNKYTDCTRKGAGVVDHVKPINEGGAPLDPENLQTLCTMHHNQKSGREAHKSKKND